MAPDRVASILDDIAVLEKEAPEVLRHQIGALKALANRFRTRVETRHVRVYGGMVSLEERP
jgi:lactam utilization protein B